VLTSHIMLRRLKKDVLGEIPPLQRSRISVLPDPKNLKVLCAHPALMHRRREPHFDLCPRCMSL
jgi:hypothetical protein